MKPSSTLAILLSLALPACTGSMADGRNRPMAPAALDTARFDAAGIRVTGRCEDVAGRYADVGHVFGQEGEAPAAGFAAGVFRMVLPADQGRPRANEVLGLRLDASASALTVDLHGAGVSRERVYPCVCEDGWVRVVVEEGKQGLADGVTQQALRSDIWLARAISGEVLVQVSARGRDSYYLARNLPWSKDAWYRFPAVAEAAPE